MKNKGITFFLLSIIIINAFAFRFNVSAQENNYVTMISGENGLCYPDYKNDAEYEKLLKKWIEKYGYSGYFSEYLNKNGSLNSFLNQTIETPFVDDEGKAFLTESDINIKQLMAYALFIDETKDYAKKMETDVLAHRSVKYSMDYGKAYEDLIAFYQTYLLFESSINQDEELCRDVITVLFTKAAISSINNSDMSDTYGYVTDFYNVILDESDKDNDSDQYELLLSGGDSDSFEGPIKEVIDKYNKNEKRLNSVKKVLSYKSKEDKTITGEISVGFDAFINMVDMCQEKTGHEIINMDSKYYKNYKEASDVSQSVVSMIKAVTVAPSCLTLMAVSYKLTKKYIEEVKKVADNAQKNDAGWYGLCVYKMVSNHPETMNSIIDTNDFSVIPFMQSDRNFEYDSNDTMYTLLLQDYETYFAAPGNGANLNMPTDSQRYKMIRAAEMLDYIKSFDSDELIDCIIQNIIVKNKLTRTYSIDVDNNAINFSPAEEGYSNVEIKEVIITNNGQKDITLLQPTSQYYEIDDIDKRILKPDEEMIVHISPKHNMPKYSKYEIITFKFKECSKIETKVALSFCVLPKKPSTDEIIEIKNNETLTIGEECILKDKNGIIITHDTITNYEDRLNNGLVLSGGTLIINKNTFINKLTLKRGTINIKNDSQLICYSLDRLEKETVSVNDGELRVLADTDLSNGVNVNSNANMVFENNLSFNGNVGFGNGKVEVFGNTKGLFYVDSGEFVCYGNLEGGLIAGKGKTDIKGDFIQNQKFSMDYEQSYVMVEGNYYANTYTYSYSATSLSTESKTLNKGVLELKGDLISLNMEEQRFESKYSFSTKNSSVKVILSGSNIQNIEGLGNYFEYLDVQNKKIASSTGFSVGNLLSDVVIQGDTGNISIQHWNGHTVHVMGNLICVDRSDDLSFQMDMDEEGKLIIDNNFVGRRTVRIKNASLYVKGNVTIDGCFFMENDKAIVTVEGDLVMNGTTFAEYLAYPVFCGENSKGILRIGGDLLGDGYKAQGSHIIEFYGGNRHTISQISTQIAGLKTGINDVLVIKNELKISKLESDIVIDNDINKKFDISNSNNKKVIINGNFTATNYFNNVNYLIKGNLGYDSLSLSYGLMRISNSNIEVMGDLNLSGINIISSIVNVHGNFTYSSDFSMSGKNTVINVWGTLIAKGYTRGQYTDRSSYLKEGVINLYGDFIASDREDVFYSSDKVDVRIVGEGVQTINGKNILIGKLTPLNPNITSQNGFSVNLLSNDWNINGDISGLSLNDISGKTIIVSGNMKDLKNVYNGNIIVGGKVTFSKSNLSNAALINMCNITAEECSGGNIKIGNNVKINSNLIIEEMDITPNSILEIGGNLTYNSYIHMRDDTSKLIVNGDFIVGKNGSTYNNRYSYYTVLKGTIILRGDIIAPDNISYCTNFPKEVNVILDGNNLQNINGNKINLGKVDFNNTNISTSTGFNVKYLNSNMTLINPAKPATIGEWNDYDYVLKDTEYKVSGVNSPSNYNVSETINNVDGFERYTTIFSPEYLDVPKVSLRGQQIEKGTEISFSHRKNVVMYYTLDGSEPTNQSKIYDGPIIINDDTTIRIMATLSGISNSSILTETYTLHRYNIESDKTEISLNKEKSKEDEEIHFSVNEIAGKTFSNQITITDYMGNDIPYRFDGTNYTFIMPASDVMIDAVFDNNIYEINYHLDNDCILEDAVDFYEYDTVTELPVPKKKGFIFEGWTKTENDSKLIQQLQNDETGNVELWARWKEKEEYDAIFEKQRYYYDGKQKSYIINSNEFQISYLKNGEIVTDALIQPDVYDVRIIREEDEKYKEYLAVIENGLEIFICDHENTSQIGEEKKPTCVNDGKTEGEVCTICGNVIEPQKSVPALGHDFEVPRYIWDDDYKTCTAIRKCSRCDEEITEMADSVRVSTPATCKTDGMTTYTATFTKEGFVEQTMSIDINANGHQYGTLIPEVPSTCTEDGVKAHYECSVCHKLFVLENESYTEKTVEELKIPAKGHTLDQEVVEEKYLKSAADCTHSAIYYKSCVCGEKGLDTFEYGDALGHNYGTPTYKWSDDGKSCVAKVICENDVTHIIEEEATINAEITIPSTCKEKGITTYTATFENELFTMQKKEIRDVPLSTIHVLGDAGIEDEVKANCEADGSYEEVVYCSVCRKELSREKKIVNALGHDWDEWTVQENATENANGKEIRSCKHEGCTQSESRDIPMLTHVHKLVKNDSRDSTCKEEGTIEYWFCKECGKMFADEGGKSEINKEDIIVSKLAHTPADLCKEKEIAPTCETDGSYDEVIKCSKCGEEISRKSVTVNALGHDWNEWTVTKEATEKETGIYTHVCKNNPEHKETKEIPVLSHIHNIITVAETAATCINDGMKAHYRCSGCDLLFEDKDGKNVILDEASLITKGSHQGGKATCNHKAICDLCQQEYGELMNHIPAKTIKENVTEPTYEKGGSYDEVIKCSLCGEELSRKTIRTDSLVRPDKKDDSKKDNSSIPMKKEDSPVVKAKKEGATFDVAEENAEFIVISKENEVPAVEYKMPTDSTSKIIIIPQTVKVEGVTYNVTKIANEAFKNNKKVEKVIIGENIEIIGQKAFYGCKKLKCVVISGRVRIIEKYAFYGCKNLKTVTIKSTKLTKTSIGKKAFKNINKKATFRCPKKQLKNYKKWIKKAGAPKTAKYKKQ